MKNQNLREDIEVLRSRIIKPDLPISDSTLTDVFIVDEYRKKLTKYQMKKVKYVGHDARSTYESDNLQ